MALILSLTSYDTSIRDNDGGRYRKLRLLRDIVGLYRALPDKPYSRKGD